MPIKIKKVIVHFDNVQSYIEEEYETLTEVDFPYLAGKMRVLIPEGVKRKFLPDSKVNLPLFNQSGRGKIIVPVGSNGVYLLQLRSRYCLDEIIVEPDDVFADIYFNDEDEALIYSFYNPTRRNAISITARVVEDIGGIYRRINSEPEDIHMRQYFILRAIRKAGTSSIDEPKKILSENMNAREVAEYLNVSEKTIRNWTHTGKIPCVKLGANVRYPKKEIDATLAKSEIGNKRFKKQT